MNCERPAGEGKDIADRPRGERLDYILLDIMLANENEQLEPELPASRILWNRVRRSSIYFNVSR
jgi:hypothetical protein